MLARPPEPAELALLTTALAGFQAEYAAAPAEATALLDVGDAPDDQSLAAGDLAAYTLVAHILLCRDEAVMRN